MTLLVKIFLGWMIFALLLTVFIGNFIRKGRGPDAQNEDN